MKITNVIATLLLMIIFSVGASAQKAKLQRANGEFDKYNFDAAIPLYLEILDKVDVAEAKIRLAESYRRVNNWTEAEYWYGQIVHLPDAKPIYSLYYGKSLQANGKCDLAKEWFEEYSRLEPDDLRGQLLSQACTKDEIERMVNKCNDCYEIQPVPINTKYDDFGPMFFNGGLIFASERDEGGAISRVHEWTGFPFLELFFTQVDTLDANNYEFTYEKDPKEYRGKINTKYHDGPISFSQDEQTIYITRNNFFKNEKSEDDEGVTRLKVFVGKRDGEGWKDLTGLPFNSDEYSVAHPTMAPDGKTLIFSSDMPGGFGGMDLYSSTYEDGQWGPPINLGPRINTEGHEVFPFYHHSSSKLYFASDGQVGLGGLDIYYVIDIDGVYTPPANVGAPINSKWDDHSIILDEKEAFGYFSSNRSEGLGRDDIYSFRKKVVKVEVLVFDQYTTDPIPNAEVYIDCSKETLSTANNGRVEIEMPIDKCCNFTASKVTYMEKTMESCTEGYEPGTKMFVKIPLLRPLDFNLAGTVTDSETGLPIANAKVYLFNDCDEAEREMTTSTDGKYAFPDLAMNCCYRVKAVKEPMYLAGNVDKICTRGQVKSMDFVEDIQLTPTFNRPGDVPPMADLVDLDNDGTPDGWDFDGDGKIDRPMSVAPLEAKAFVIEHIYYDFDQSYIRDDAQGPLDTLIDILNDNENYIVEIGSHTDARGSDRYNQQLSQRRAQAVVEYLVQKGISQDRLTYFGYGESNPSNDCVNEVPCSEEQHQRNRRTEFKIAGTLDGVEFDTKTSIAPTHIRTDRCTTCPF